MPEGPEVNILAEQLNNFFKKSKATIIESFFSTGKNKKKKPINFTTFQKTSDLQIKKIESRGKLLWFTVKNEDTVFYIISTLGLTGYWSILDDEDCDVGDDDCSELYKPSKRFEVFRINLSDGHSLIYEDMRKFGTIVFADKEELKRRLDKIGPDLLQNDISFEDFSKKIKNKNIVKFLMNDQKIFSGIGNYGIAELLYRAKISPHRNLTDLSKQELKNLLHAIKYILKLFYELQGGQYDYLSSIKLKSKDLKKLTFQVYRQKLDPLGNEVSAETIIPGRTIYWSPSIQI